MPAGQPTKYEARFCEMLVEHMATPHSFESFGAVVKVSRDTLYEWRRVHPEFSYAVKRGRIELQRSLEQDMRGLWTGRLKGNAAALIFFMKNTTGFRDDPVQDDEDAVDGLIFNHE